MASASHKVGGEGRHGGYKKYFLFSIPIEIGKRCEYVEYDGYQKRCEKVYVKEVDVLNKPKKLLPKVIERSSG